MTRIKIARLFRNTLPTTKPIGLQVAKAPANLRSLARAHTDMALRQLVNIACNGENESARVAASVHILDRGWGKAPQAHTGEDGEGAISVVIRHIIEAAAGSTVQQRTVDQGDDAKVITLVPRTTGDDR